MQIIISDETKTEIFTKTFLHLNQFSTMVNLRFQSEALYIQGLDSNHISLFEIRFCKDWFKQYEVEEPQVLGINIELLSKILNFRNKCQDIVLRAENMDHLFIDLISSEKNIISKYFKIPIYDIDTDLMEIPEVEYQADFIIGSKPIKEFIDQMSTFGEILKLNCDETEIRLSVEGDDGEMDVTLDFDLLDEYAIEEDKQIELCYNLKYIIFMLKYADIFPNVHIYMSTKFPLKMSFDMEDGTMHFFLAPQIQD